MREIRHADRIKGRDKPVLVTATEAGREAWFVLQVAPEKQAAFHRLKLLKQGDIADYGVILASGWGAVDDALRARLQEEYGI